jgi:lysyl-tRNA synthetase, class II
MASIDELKLERLKKVEALESEGFSAYPSKSEYTKTISKFLEDFNIDELLDGEKIENILVGRIIMSRSFGNLAFAKIFDGTGSVQVVFEREKSEESINYFEKHIDGGDFVQVTGTNYVTKKGENSLLVSNIKLLSKALLPLPDKHAGLVDEEEKMRKRYLDILLDENKRDLFYKKAKFWKVVRSFLDEKNFLEVETPTLEVTTGGAEARPFKTHHNDYDLDVYMRISVGELWQKRLMSAGFPRTYEIGRAYRNEGSSPNHLQEFTNCEFYMAYANYKDGMEMTKELYRKIATEVFGKTEFTHNGMTFDLAADWGYVDYAEEIKRVTGINVDTSTEEEMKDKLKELHVKYEGENRERLLDTLWKYCRKSIAGPAFLINHPSLTSPLAKRREEDINTVEKFQIILAGAEVGNGYSELNDPRLQRENFEQQQKMLEGGDEEAMMPDFDFVEMLEHGMPPTCGFGFGDRLFAFLAGLPIRETQLFPLVKPIISVK